MTVASRLKKLQQRLAPPPAEDELPLVIPLSPDDFAPSDSEDAERLPAQVKVVKVGQQTYTVTADGKLHRGEPVYCLMPDDFGPSTAESRAGEAESQENATRAVQG